MSLRSLLNLPQFVSWLERQPADEEYCYIMPGHCLIARYLTDHGCENVGVSFLNIRAKVNGREQQLTPPPPVFDNIALPSDDRTFGGALKRARAYLAATKQTNISIFTDMLTTQAPLVEHRSAAASSEAVSEADGQQQ